jgi:lipopolysaccharide transport system ATP-binding protein
MTPGRQQGTEVVASVDSIGKCYARYTSNLHRFVHWFGVAVRPVSEHWAVREVSFNLHRGECVAIIGQNGAGKSTLLKIITGTVRPTEGATRIAGRVNALLELGLGFNPEFTGRENVRVAGGLMGLSSARIAELMPQVEDFAEIGEFMDQPLRVYSSGMQARLAFSLATAERPDLLIVDEILSVGDSYFSHKSFDRIRAFRDQGTSILFVTHGMGDVRTLCDRVVLLDRGRVLKDGAPDEVVDYYNALVAAKEAAKLSVEQRRVQGGWLHTRSGSGAARIVDVRLVDAASGEAAVLARVGQNLRLQAWIECCEALPRLVVGFMLRDRLGHVVWGTNTWHTNQVVRNSGKGQTLRVDLDFENTLGPGSYAFSMALHSDDSHVESNYEWQDNLLAFDVVNADRPPFIGSSWIASTISISTPDAGVGKQSARSDARQLAG